MIHILLLPLPLLLFSFPFLSSTKGLTCFPPYTLQISYLLNDITGSFFLSFLLLSLHHVKSIGLFIGIQMKYHTLQHFFSLLYNLNIDIDINRNVRRHLIYMLRSSLLFGLYIYLYFDFSRLSLLYSTLLLLLCRVLSSLFCPGSVCPWY